MELIDDYFLRSGAPPRAPRSASSSRRSVLPFIRGLAMIPRTFNLPALFSIAEQLALVGDIFLFYVHDIDVHG